MALRIVISGNFCCLRYSLSSCNLCILVDLPLTMVHILLARLYDIDLLVCLGRNELKCRYQWFFFSTLGLGTWALELGK